MRTLALAIILLLALAAVADAIVMARSEADPVRVGAVLAATALVLGALVALSESKVTRTLRDWAGKSRLTAISLPLLLIVPYLLYGAGTRTFSWYAVLKLTAYILAPAILLLPDLRRHRERLNWRDLAATAAIAVPIPAGWLRDVWTWPEYLYFLLPLTAVCSGVYAFVVVRRLDGVGYRLLWRKADVTTGLANWALFTIFAIPLGYALHFIRFHPHSVSWSTLGLQFLGIYLTIAIPEELMFRGILQNLLEKSVPSDSRGRWGLVIASVIFGASHFHHPPVPNWRYCIMATLAGIFYGLAYQTRRRISASALTHALVDTLWHFWF